MSIIHPGFEFQPWDTGGYIVNADYDSADSFDAFTIYGWELPSNQAYRFLYIALPRPITLNKISFYLTLVGAPLGTSSNYFIVYGPSNIILFRGNVNVQDAEGYVNINIPQAQYNVLSLFIGTSRYGVNIREMKLYEPIPQPPPPPAPAPIVSPAQAPTFAPAPIGTPPAPVPTPSFSPSIIQSMSEPPTIDYPTIPLTGNISNGCIASASSVFNFDEGTYGAFRAFDDNIVTEWIPREYSSTTDTTGTVHTGAWVQIKLPYPILLYKYRARIGDTVSKLFGSNDGTSWTWIDCNQAQTTDGLFASFIYTPKQKVTTRFSYFRLLNNIRVYNLRLIELQSDTIIPPPAQPPAPTFAPAPAPTFSPAPAPAPAPTQKVFGSLVTASATVTTNGTIVVSGTGYDYFTHVRIVGTNLIFEKSTVSYNSRSGTTISGTFLGVSSWPYSVNTSVQIQIGIMYSPGPVSSTLNPAALGTWGGSTLTTANFGSSVITVLDLNTFTYTESSGVTPICIYNEKYNDIFIHRISGTSLLTKGPSNQLSRRIIGTWTSPSGLKVSIYNTSGTSYVTHNSGGYYESGPINSILDPLTFLKNSRAYNIDKISLNLNDGNLTIYTYDSLTGAPYSASYITYTKESDNVQGSFSDLQGTYSGTVTFGDGPHTGVTGYIGNRMYTRPRDDEIRDADTYELLYTVIAPGVLRDSKGQIYTAPPPPPTLEHPTIPLTSDISNGYKVSAKSTVDGLHPYYAFDNNPSTSWQPFNADDWIQIQLPYPILLQKYKKNSGYTRSGLLYGSNDGISWTYIDCNIIDTAVWANVECIPKQPLTTKFSYFAIQNGKRITDIRLVEILSDTPAPVPAPTFAPAPAPSPTFAPAPAPGMVASAPVPAPTGTPPAPGMVASAPVPAPTGTPPVPGMVASAPAPVPAPIGTPPVTAPVPAPMFALAPTGTPPGMTQPQTGQTYSTTYVSDTLTFRRKRDGTPKTVKYVFYMNGSGNRFVDSSLRKEAFTYQLEGSRIQLNYTGGIRTVTSVKTIPGTQ